MPSVQEYLDRSWNSVVGRGDTLNQESKDRASEDRQRYEQTRGYLDPYMQQWAEGGGGYSPEEAAAIQREGELNSYMATTGDYGRYGLTPEEEAQVRGDPGRYFRPDDMQARQTESENAIRGGVNTMEERLYESAGSPGLDISSGYRDATGNAITDSSTRVRGAIDPTRLRADTGALDQIRMSPEEEQGYIDAASQTAGKAYRAQLQDVEARQRAAGVPQAGIGAQRLRYLRSSAADEADAATKARMDASGQRASRAGAAEEIRQAGERSYTGAAVPAELQLAQQAIAAGRDVEGMRLDAARDIANRYERAATTVGQARTGTESDIYGQRQRTGEYITNTGTGIENTEASRSAAVAGNRQQTERDITGQRWQQGQAANDALSNRATTVANQRANQTAAGRGYFADYASQEGAREDAERSRQNQIYGTQTSGTLGVTEQQAAQANKPKWWEKLAGAGVGAAASYFGGK